MKQLIELIYVELKLYFRDRAALFWTFLFPFLILVIFMSIPQDNNSVYESELIFIEAEDSKISNAVFTSLLNNVSSKVGPVRTSHVTTSNILQAVPNNALQIELSEEKPSVLKISHGSTPSQSTLLLLELIKGIYSDKAANEVSSKDIYDLEIYTFSTVSNLNEKQDKQVLTVGLICMSIMSTCFFGFSVILVQLRATNSLKMFQVMPIHSTTFIGAFIICRVIIILIFAIIFLAVADLLYDIDVQYTLQNFASFIALVSLGALTFISIGILVASRVSSVSAANGIINIIYFPLIFLSGLFFPISSDLPWLDTIASYLPLREYAQMFHQIMFHNTSFIQFTGTLILMMLWGGIPFLISQRNFVWNAEK